MATVLNALRDGFDVADLNMQHITVLESELVPEPYVMLCRKEKRNRRRNQPAEKVLKKLHFVVPDIGIYGPVYLLSHRGAITFGEASLLLVKV